MARSVPKIMSERRRERESNLTRVKLVEAEVEEEEVQKERRDRNEKKRETRRISFIWLGPLGSILGILSDPPAS